MNRTIPFLWTLSVWVFLAIKVAGTAFAAWSWWWLLLPPIPVMALVLAKLGVGGIR